MRLRTRKQKKTALCHEKLGNRLTTALQTLVLFCYFESFFFCTLYSLTRYSRLAVITTNTAEFANRKDSHSSCPISTPERASYEKLYDLCFPTNRAVRLDQSMERSFRPIGRYRQALPQPRTAALASQEPGLHQTTLRPSRFVFRILKSRLLVSVIANTTNGLFNDWKKWTNQVIYWTIYRQRDGPHSYRERRWTTCSSQHRPHRSAHSPETPGGIRAWLRTYRATLNGAPLSI